MVQQHFLAHRDGDAVAVAVVDVEPGEARVGFVDGGSTVVEVTDSIPLGHKVALRALTQGDDVIEYGVRVALASADIQPGQHVHVHNVRSARWQSSIA